MKAFGFCFCLQYNSPVCLVSSFKFPPWDWELANLLESIALFYNRCRFAL